jgi:hypothetical protein
MLAQWDGNMYPKNGDSQVLVGVGCDEGGNGVQLVAQSVPKWGLEIAESSIVWRVEGMRSQLYSNQYPTI